MAAEKNPRAARRAEPAARRGAAAGMTMQLLSAAAPRQRAASAGAAAATQGEAAFDSWLRRELGRLYDATLAEPVPEELVRLLDSRPRQAARRR